ncbi:glycosyltransferase family 4 protein [Shimia sp. MMG029]|nr:glycosyltransferase family 4 protein [Shimia sp. MMG029]MDA5557536.1 glycosyltransferase family 4 protein [Shimia sp. MMG029]
MGRIAFYAPLKSPNHTVPSGEREIARNLMQALAVDDVVPVLASEFRSFEKQGDAAQQQVLIAQATQEADKLIARGKAEGWQAWLTYHNYYKAPDLLGPLVTQALGIPYLLVEATLANKRLDGPWDAFERRAKTACQAADVIFSFTERDAMALRAELGAEKLVSFPPFVALERLPEIAKPEAPIVLVAGMMRAGDKFASYQIIADTLAQMPDQDWQLEVAGDGPKQADVAALLAPFGARVRFLGQLDAAGMAAAYARAKAFFWPGVNEAFGMVYLEAQARGVPVIAEDRPGVREVVDPSGLVAQGSPKSLSDALISALFDASYHLQRSEKARALIAAHHLLPAARDTLWSALRPLLKEKT